MHVKHITIKTNSSHFENFEHVKKHITHFWMLSAPYYSTLLTNTAEVWNHA